ncbi:MAG: LAGLIDADG family homing endonuclease [Patescibacteria group bacterium]|nr:LAGLIDADG family homing endonuclease [Patescibacteria group bacterium]
MSSKNASHADNQQTSRKKISDEYLAGFVDGEGCFYVGFSKRSDLPLGWQILTEFHLSQNPGRLNLLEEFRKRVGCGYLKPNHAKNPKDRSWVLVIKDRKDLKEKLIPFFKKCPLHSQKQQEFIVFAKVLSLIEKKKHLQKQGFRKIVNLVFSLPRLTNKRYSKNIILSS